MRTSKFAAIIACTLLLAAIGNAVITFALEPYASNSEVSWHDYEQMEELDTVIIGSSHVQQDVNPIVLDEDLGSISENLGVPSQTLPETLAAIQTAYDDHGIKRVILGLSPNTLVSSDPPDPGKAFLRWRAANVPLTDTIGTTAWILFAKGAWKNPESLNLFSPWVSNHVEFKWKKIKQNIKLKLNGTSYEDAIAKTQKTWNYVGRGYGARTYVLDYSGVRAIPYFMGASTIAAGGNQTGDVTGGVTIDLSVGMSDASRTSLSEICSYCNERGIQLVCIIPPFPTYNVIYCGEAYYRFSDDVRAFVEEQGALFCDFNLAKPELFDAKPEYFADSEHLHVSGGEPFSKALAKWIQAAEAGRSTSQWFYTPEEHYASLDHIETMFLDVSKDAEAVHLSAEAVASPQVRAEYRFFVKLDGEWVLIRDWDVEPTCDYVPEGHEEVSLRAETREVGSAEEYERHRVTSVLF